MAQVNLSLTCAQDLTSGSTASWSAVLIPALLRMARKWKQCECPSADEFIVKIQYVHTVEYLLVSWKEK